MRHADSSMYVSVGVIKRRRWRHISDPHGDRWQRSTIGARDSERDKRTHPVIVKHAAVDLVEDVARRTLERGFDVLARLGARLDKEQALLLRPQLGFLCGNLAPAPRRDGHVVRVCAEVDLVPDEDTGEVRVCVLAHVREPRADVREAWEKM